MERIGKTGLIIFLAVTGIFFLQFHAKAAGDQSKDIKQIDQSLVCMVNDTIMGKPQIPVLFEGKTYYGCCEGCIERIKSDRSVRFSKDPSTGREVDKAKAFITAAPDGAALYFESRDTAGKYYAPIKTKEGKTGGAAR